MTLIRLVLGIVMVLGPLVPVVHGSSNTLVASVNVSTEHTEIGRVPDATVFRSHRAVVSLAWSRMIARKVMLGLSGEFEYQDSRWDVWDSANGYRGTTMTNQGIRTGTASLETAFGDALSEMLVRVGLQLPGTLGRDTRSIWNLPAAPGVPVVTVTVISSTTRDPAMTYVGVMPSFPIKQKFEGSMYRMGSSIRFVAGMNYVITRNLGLGGSVLLGVKGSDRLDGVVLPATEKISLWVTPTVVYAPSPRTQLELGVSMPIHTSDPPSMELTFRWMQ